MGLGKKLRYWRALVKDFLLESYRSCPGRFRDWRGEFQIEIACKIRCSRFTSIDIRPLFYHLESFVRLTGIERGQIEERFFPREGKRRERILKQGEVCLHYTFVPQPHFIQLDFRGG